MSYFNCYICNKLTPLELKEDHHEIPQAYGGEHGIERKTCNGCHDTLHKIANLIFFKKAGRIREILSLTYGDNRDAMEKIISLANIIVQNRILKDDGKVKRDKEPVNAYVLPATKQMLKLIAQERGISMKDLVSSILEGFVSSKFPHA